MELKLVTNTARSAVLELTESGKFYTESQYDIYVNDEKYMESNIEVLCADDLVYSRLDIAVIHHHITVDLFTVYDYADDLAVLDNSLFHGRVEHYLTAELCECLAVCIGDSLAAAFGIARSSCGGFPAQAAHKFSGACFPVRQAGVNCANHPDA